MDASFPPARFKRFLSGITLFIALTFIILSSFHDAYSAQVTLERDPNTESDLAGYKLYYGTASGDYAQVVSPRSRNGTIVMSVDLTPCFFRLS